MSRWHPKASQLNGYAHDQLEAAYQNRERVRCSRDDFYDGYLACLRDLRARAMFQPGEFENNAEASDE